MNVAGVSPHHPAGQSPDDTAPKRSDRWQAWWPLAFPVGAVCGAASALPVAWWVVVGVGGVAAWLRFRRAMVPAWMAAVCAVTLGCAALSANAWQGLGAALPERIDGRVELVKDPRPIVRGVRVEVRHDGVRYDAFARGAPAGVMTNLRAGESVELVGRVARRDPSDRWRASRHVAGLIEVEQARRPASARGPWAVANAVHRAMGRGAQDLPAAQRGVLLGVSVGDRSAMPAAVGDDLRAAGLSHLTAVSGQHVALLLAMVAPVMRRIPLRPRAVAVAAVLVGFVVLTRGEPSVLRAVGMALAVEVARSGGQQVRGLRVLGLTVTMLLIIDPLLVWSVAFQLSVAATLGIAVGASGLAARIPGPRYVTKLAAMGICAQLAVAPLAVTYFGQVPVTGVVANVLAAPVVGVMMGWGLSAGVVAGMTGIGTGVIHVPTMVLGGWLVSVAGWFASLPVGQARPVHVVVVTAAVAVVMIAGRRGWLAVRRAAKGIVIVTLVVAVAMPQGSAPGRHDVATGAEVLVGGDTSVVVIDGRAEVAAVLAGLRGRGVVRIEAVVSRTGSAGSVGVAKQVCDRLGPCSVMVPAHSVNDSPISTSPASVDAQVVVVTTPLSLAVDRSRMVVVDVDGERLTAGFASPLPGPPADSAPAQTARPGGT